MEKMDQNFIVPSSVCSFSFTFFFILFSNYLTTPVQGRPWGRAIAAMDATTGPVNGENPQLERFLGDVAINCGCVNNSTAHDGRRWVGETPFLQPKGKSKSTTIPPGHLLTADPTPFFTARISSTGFYYDFRVNPGQKFVRFHFYPVSYLGFRDSQDFFTVKANSFTLLHNFSATIAAIASDVKYFVKEFCLTVNETGILRISFFAYRRINRMSKFHAFVNGIEIISMPVGLYYTPNGSLGVPIVGRSNHFYHVDDTSALELIRRVNVGGGSILPVEDTGMFRGWSEDSDHDHVLELFEFQEMNYMMPVIEYASRFIAPLKIYQTSRMFRKGLQSEEKHDFTWKLPVDIGFGYLLRLHFCYCINESADGSPENFNVIIQNVVAETQVDVIKMSGGNGIPVYRDYLVMMKGDKAEGKRELFISLQSVDELVLGLLKGLEIFKLSNPDNSLASPNPSGLIRDYSVCSLKIQAFLVAFVIMTILLVMLNAAAYKLTNIREHKIKQDKHGQFAPDEPSCHHFLLNDILLATRNFDEALVIGKGGFGKVYKGFVYGHPEVLAIKRLKAESKQGAVEFWREIETLSKLRHIHLVPLIGYCNEGDEMILVYEYMPRGTVADTIYKARINGEEGVVPLTWDQRLRICIGAARGLDYLHTGTQYGVIHRDVKDTNILLDENYVAKISDFGLSKQGSTIGTQGQLSTKVWGTDGYLDPHYITTRKPSITSDVYAFGIVLLVVLSGRPAVETKLFSENVSLLACFQECMEKGVMKDIIDPSMQGEISVESLTKFIEAVVNCVHHVPKKRPSMAHVVVFLEHALEKHQGLVPSTLIDETVVAQPLELQVPQKLEECFVPFLLEEHASEEIQQAGLPTNVEVLEPLQIDRGIAPKPLWGRPLYALKNILKSNKKKDIALQPPNIFSPEDMKSATQNFQKRLLAYTNERLFEAVFERLKARTYTEKTYIVREGDPVDEMLFIIHGQLESVTTDGGSSGISSLRVLKEVDFCGEELLTWTMDLKPDSNLPLSTRTVKALTEVEGFSLAANEVKFLTNHFRRMQNKQEQHTFRYYSYQWRAWAAIEIQISWHRFSKRKRAEELRRYELEE